ncbi:hypothetical protein TIFTF001_027745 [Ficus carica]|uniref:Secreted protein n=1 Tax=Ficus carica TaxID=3494 RepID=A0AA88J0L8_FICCA|nr:hypothetical protein TIFTF001_027745 [Ficus carica]
MFTVLPTIAHLLLHSSFVYCAPNARPSAASQCLRLLCSQPSPICCFIVHSFTVLLPLSHVLLQWRSPFFLYVLWVFKLNIFDSLNALVPTVCSIFPRVEFL